jgi:hypothetical protein
MDDDAVCNLLRVWLSDTPFARGQLHLKIQHTVELQLPADDLPSPNSWYGLEEPATR